MYRWTFSGDDIVWWRNVTSRAMKPLRMMVYGCRKFDMVVFGWLVGGCGIKTIIIVMGMGIVIVWAGI